MHSFGLILTKHCVAIYNMIMSTFTGRVGGGLRKAQLGHNLVIHGLSSLSPSLLDT